MVPGGEVGAGMVGMAAGLGETVADRRGYVADRRGSGAVVARIWRSLAQFGATFSQEFSKNSHKFS